LPSANCHVWMFHRLLHFSLSNFTQGNYIYNSIIVINSEDDDDDDAPSLHWLRVRESILFKIAVMTFSALNGSAPVCLPSYFTRVPDVPSRQRLRSASSNQLRLTSPPSANRKASFRCHLLEHNDICTVAGDIQTASYDISLSLDISGLNILICSLLHCRPSDNLCYLGHTKIQMMIMMMMMMMMTQPLRCTIN